MPPRLTGKPRVPKGENINVRLPIRLRFALELLSRKRGVGISTIVIDALEALLRASESGLNQKKLGAREPVYVPDEVWDPVESDRLLKTATAFPQFLSDKEVYMWKVIQESPRFYPEGIGPNYHEVRTHWQWVKSEAEELEKLFGGNSNG